MDLPDKHFYTIGDVSALTKIQPHVLRYWENHFKVLRPARRYSGHRKYTQREIDLINRIRYLVVDRKFTLSGARREINRQLGMRPQPLPTAPSKSKIRPSGECSHKSALQDLKKDIEDCLSILKPKNQLEFQALKEN